MVAVASPRDAVSTRSADLSWSIGALAVLMVAIALRLLLGGGAVGDRSAIVMLVLLGVGTWLAVRLLTGPRAAFLALLALLACLDLAALPQRNAPAYDDLQAFYATDQVLAATVPVPVGIDPRAAGITLLAQPVFAGTQPQFGLAGDVNGSAAQWACTFVHGIQSVALPLPPGTSLGGSASIRLHLTGTPNQSGDYLVVYASSRQGGFLISLGAPEAGATHCALQ